MCFYVKVLFYFLSAMPPRHRLMGLPRARSTCTDNFNNVLQALPTIPTSSTHYSSNERDVVLEAVLSLPSSCQWAGAELNVQCPVWALCDVPRYVPRYVPRSAVHTAAVCVLQRRCPGTGLDLSSGHCQCTWATNNRTRVIIT